MRGAKAWLLLLLSLWSISKTTTRNEVPPPSTAAKVITEGDEEALTCAGEDAVAVDFVKSVISHMEGGKPARSFDVEDPFADLFNDLMFLTNKPILYVCNVDENSVVDA